MSDTLTGKWLASRPAPVRRRQGRHRVTAILVSHDGEAWLPRVLEGLSRSTRKPDKVIAVDTGSRDSSADLLRESPVVGEILVADRGTGFGAAVALGASGDDRVVDVSDSSIIDLRHGRDVSPATPPHMVDGRLDPGVEWLWLLHDDVEVSPEALARLLWAADAHPDAEVIGPKTKGWDDPGLVVECGVTIAASGRREIGVTRGERDQGQLDRRLDVLAVGSAGMLVRRDLWERLGGFDAELPLFRDDLEFCWRARRSGARVIVAPEAEVRHMEAASRGKRELAATPDDAQSADRRAAAMVLLAYAPKRRVALKGLRLFIGSLIHGILMTLVKVSDGAWDELRAVLGALSSRGAVGRMRARVRAVESSDGDSARGLRPSSGETATHWQDDLAQALGAEAGGDVRDALRSRLLNARNFAQVVILPVLVVCLWATWDLWFGAGRLLGGALLPSPDGAADLLSSFASSWHESGLGSAVPSSPYLVILAIGSVPLFGSATMAVQVMLLLGPVFAAISSYFSLRGLARGVPRIAAALTYALLPATIAAVGTGRLGTIAVAVLLPPTARMVARVSTLSRGTLRTASWSTTGGAALLAAALFAFSPSVALLIGISGLLIAVFRRTRTSVARMLVVVVAPLAILWPWSGYVLANPVLVLFDAGAISPSLTDPAASPLGLLALDPGGPAAPPALLSGIITALALIALVRSGARGRAMGAWVFFLVALTLAVGQSVLLFSVPWSQLPQSAWPGSMTVVMGAALIFAVFTGGPIVRAMRRGKVAVAVGLLAPTLLAAWWGVAQVQVVERGDASGVSPFVAAEMVGPNAPRTVVISGDRDGAVSYRIISGDGARIGDADVAPPVSTIAELDGAIARMVAGQGDTSVLAASAIKYVQVRHRSNVGIARRLDAVPGLRRLSTVADTALWTVTDARTRTVALDSDGAWGRLATLALPLLALLATLGLALPRARGLPSSRPEVTRPDSGGEGR